MSFEVKTYMFFREGLLRGKNAARRAEISHCKIIPKLLTGEKALVVILLLVTTMLVATIFCIFALE